MAFLTGLDAQKSPVLTVDLTKPQPREQQGLGVPGGEGGARIGGERNEHGLPVQVKIVAASVQSSRDFIIEVQVKNMSDTAIELPVSRSISDVQRTPGSFRRELIFDLRQASSESNQHWVVGVTAGSRAVPQSLLRLPPHESIRVLLPVQGDWVRNALPRNASKVDLRVACNEWILGDSGFVVDAIAGEVLSQNIAKLGFSDDTPTSTVANP